MEIDMDMELSRQEHGHRYENAHENGQWRESECERGIDIDTGVTWTWICA
jgi:hypothetical protein